MRYAAKGCHRMPYTAVECHYMLRDASWCTLDTDPDPSGRFRAWASLTVSLSPFFFFFFFLFSSCSFLILFDFHIFFFFLFFFFFLPFLLLFSFSLSLSLQTNTLSSPSHPTRRCRLFLFLLGFIQPFFSPFASFISLKAFFVFPLFLFLPFLPETKKVWHLKLFLFGYFKSCVWFVSLSIPFVSRILQSTNKKTFIFKKKERANINYRFFWALLISWLIWIKSNLFPLIFFR